MLLPTILWILDQPQIQPKVEQHVPSGFGAELDSAREGLLELEKGEAEKAVASKLLKQTSSELPIPEKTSNGSGFNELLKTITKFEKSDQTRVVDVFE